MNSKTIILLLTLALMVWSCQDTPPTSEAGRSAVVQGAVFDLSTSAVIQNASVILTTQAKRETTFTPADGKFTFKIDLSKLSSYGATVTVQKFGYVSESMNISVASDTTLSVGLNVDISSTAVIVGTIRDSATSYPLRQVTVRLTIPGTDTSMVTAVDGSFRLAANLVDLETLPARITAIKPGYKAKQIDVTLRRGQTGDLGNVVMQVDLGSTAGQVVGRVLDNRTRVPITNAIVQLSAANYIDTLRTSINGDFSFTVDLAGLSSLSGLLRITNPGYISRTLAVTIQAGRTISADIVLDRDTTASSALIIGTLRDSSTLYPLRGATVLVTLPGVVDSVSTPTDGSFRLTADLVDRDSLPVIITAYKSGYKTKRLTFLVYKGQTTALGDVLLNVDKASTVGQVNGRIFDAQSRLPLNNALVTMISNILVDSLPTSISGEYSFSIDLQGLPSLPGLLKVSKNGYKPQSTNFTVDAGKSFSADFYLVRDTTTGIRDTSKTSLYAHSIAFISLSAREISVYGVGGVEASIITWEVRDSLGFPIDIDHRDTVEFELRGDPVAGGAYVSPAKALTNASGRIATTVNSGTTSGALQFIAKLRRETDSVWIQSSPVIITVNAGLPDQIHFDLAPEVHNFPAYDWVDLVDHIVVQVGDKYTNPVKLGTAVYFNTTGGIIDASGFTDRTGHAVVSLYSGKPKPSDPYYGIGFAKIAATTMGENSVYVTDTTLILFSAVGVPPIVTVDSFFTPTAGASDMIHFTVADRFGNPLAAGTQISVNVQYTPPPNSQINVVTDGDINVRLSDVMFKGPGTTDFWFRVIDQTIGGIPSRIPATAIISVTSPNIPFNGVQSAKVPGWIGNP